MTHMQPTALMAIALFGWIPISVLLYLWLKPTRGTIATFVLGWLLLPMGWYDIPGFADYTKVTAVAWGSLLSVLLLDSRRLFAFRPSWVDIPMLGWCLAPMFSSLSNGLGVYDGLGGMCDFAFMWGAPYLIGRLYFGTARTMREMMIGIVLGAILYLPLCLYEIRMSPQLHTMVYGFHQHSFMQSKREGGFRPVVFMQHGLAVAIFITSAAIVCTAFWWRKTVAKLVGLPVSWWAVSLIVLTVLCKSLGATALLVIGLGILPLVARRGMKLPMMLLLLVPLLYMSVRATGVWSGVSVLEFVQRISWDRASSLEVRLKAEDVLCRHALRQPVFGWGGWGRNRVTEEGVNMAITDGMWVIAIGKHGIFGLACLAGSVVVPAFAYLFRLSRRAMRDPVVVPAVAGVLILGVFLVDCLFNAMLNPLYMLIAGGLAGLPAPALQPATPVARRPAQPQARRAAPRTPPVARPTAPPAQT